MRIDVLPLRKVPSSISLLSYEVEEPVVYGQLIEVPFRRKKIFGIVWNTSSSYEGVVQPVTTVWSSIILNSIQRSILEAIQTTHGLIGAGLLAAHLPADRVLKSLSVVETGAKPFPTEPQTFQWYGNR